MVDSCYCLDRVVPEGMSQVWRRLEVENHLRHTLNIRLSSGNSEHTSSSSRNAPGRIIRLDSFWYWNKLKMKPTYLEKNLPNYFYVGFRSTLNPYDQTHSWLLFGIGNYMFIKWCPSTMNSNLNVVRV